jgi:hypothetical protein
LGRGPYEIRLSDDAWQRVWSKLNQQRVDTDRLYAGVTFEADLPDLILEWIDRRWNAFSAYANCSFVLAISFLGGLFFLRNPQTYWWQFGIAVAATFCVIMATLTWREAMNMIEFQAKRPITEEDGPPEEDG